MWKICAVCAMHWSVYAYAAGQFREVVVSMCRSTYIFFRNEQFEMSWFLIDILYNSIYSNIWKMIGDGTPKFVWTSANGSIVPLVRIIHHWFLIQLVHYSIFLRNHKKSNELNEAHFSRSQHAMTRTLTPKDPLEHQKSIISHPIDFFSHSKIFSHMLFINKISFPNVLLVIPAFCNNVNKWRPLYTLSSDKIVFWQTISSNSFNLDWRSTTLNSRILKCWFVTFARRNCKKNNKHETNFLTIFQNQYKDAFRREKLIATIFVDLLNLSIKSINFPQQTKIIFIVT